MNTAILEVLISVISSFLGVNLKDIKASLNQERYKGLREAYAELLNVLPEEKLLGHIIINLPSQKNFQENGLSEAYEAADMNMKIMYSHFQMKAVFAEVDNTFEEYTRDKIVIYS